MTKAVLRMRNGAIQIDENNLVIPGLMKISSETGDKNGMYLNINAGPLIDGQGYSMINLVNTDPNGAPLGVTVQNIEVTPAFSVLPGAICLDDLSNDTSIIYNEFCGTSKGSLIAGPTFDVTISNENDAAITNYLPSFEQYHDKITGERHIALWDSIERKIVDFKGFPLDENTIHSHTLQDQGVYRVSYDNASSITREIFFTDLSQPRNLANEVNDMANAIQTNPQPGCDLLPSNLF